MYGKYYIITSYTQFEMKKQDYMLYDISQLAPNFFKLKKKEHNLILCHGHSIFVVDITWLRGVHQ